MVKLVDALGSGLSRRIPVRVRVPLAAYKIFQIVPPVLKAGVFISSDISGLNMARFF